LLGNSGEILAVQPTIEDVGTAQALTCPPTALVLSRRLFVMASGTRPSTLKDLRTSGWVSRSVKQEIRSNFLRKLQGNEELFPGIIGYDHTVIPEINIALIAGHDLLFLGEKGQAKSRLMRALVRFLDDEVPYLDAPGCAVHEVPYRPITQVGKRLLAELSEEKVPIAWW